jgi:hypothetical protein
VFSSVKQNKTRQKPWAASLAAHDARVSTACNRGRLVGQTLICEDEAFAMLQR